MNKIFVSIFNPEIIQVLSHRPFSPFLLSVFISTIAINLLTMVLMFLVFSLTNSNLAVAFLILTITIPQIFISLIGGVVADINNRRSILLYGNILRAMLVLFLFLNVNSLFLIYTISFIIAVITYFYIPAEIPLIPQLVKRENLTTANSLVGISLFGSVLLAYILWGALVFLVGKSLIFIIISLLFIITALCITFIPSHLIANTHIIHMNGFIENFLHELKKVISAAFSSKLVSLSVAMMVVSQIIVFIIASLIPGYVNSVLEIGEENVSRVLFSPAAIGTIISAIFIDKILKVFKRDKLPIIGIIISSAVFLLFPLTGVIGVVKNVLASLLAFLIGIANAFIFIPTQTIIHENIPNETRSKIYGLIFSLTGLFSLPTILLSGTLADMIGIQGVFIMVGIILLCFSLVCEFSLRSKPQS